MRRKRLATAVALVVAVIFVSSQVAPAVDVNVTDPSPTFNATKYGCCPGDCPACIVTADQPTVSDAYAYYTMFGGAWDSWNNEPGNPKGWSLIDGGLLNGTFNITTYDAGFVDCYGGVKIDISYVPAVPDPSPNDVVWSQAIYTNDKKSDADGPGNPYLDIIANDPNTSDPPIYPYQYQDASFYDFPRRPCPSTCEDWIFWEGYAFLTEVDYALKQLTVYEGVTWGFTIECVPEPATITLLGLGSLVLLRRRRRKER